MYRTTILPFVVYGYEICRLTLNEKHIFGVFENRMLKIITESGVMKWQGGC